MKHFLLFSCFCLAFLFPAIPAISQSAPDFEWANRAGNTKDDGGTAIAIDANGNTFVTGYFENSITFGNTTLLSQGFNDIFIVKYNASGNVLWARRAGGSGQDYAYGIAVDPAGNCYLTGVIYGIADFGGTILTPSGSTDLFFAKYDGAGTLVWAKKAGGLGSEAAFAIAVDIAGNSYITGSFGGSTLLGNNAFFNSKGYNDLFIIKVDPIGNIIWAKQGGGPQSNDVNGYGIALDGSGNVFVVGSFTRTAVFNGISLTTALNSLETFILKYDSTGNIIWAKQGSTRSEGFGIATDAGGNCYATGYFVGQSTFGTISLTSAGSSDNYVAKYDPSGNFLWANRAGGGGSDYSNAIAVDGSGNSYITGYFSGTADFGSTNLISDGFGDVFIAKYSSSGTFLWAKQAGGTTSTDVSYGIAVDAAGNSHITGSFHTSAYFDNINLNATPASIPHTDMFVAKLGNTPVPCVSPTATISSTCSSTSQSLVFTFTGQQPWKVYYNRNNTAQVAYANTSPFTLPVTVGSTITYTLTGVSSGNCFTAATGSVVLDPLVTPQVTNSQGCAGPRTLTATGATGTATYRWYTDATTNTPIAGATSGSYTTPALTSTTTFYVSVVNANGCEGPRVAITATVSPVPAVDAGPGETVCTNTAPFALTGYSPAGGTWSGPGVSASGTFTPSISLSGAQTLTYSVTQGGCTGTATTTVTVNPTPPTPSITLIAPDSLMSSVMGNSYEWKHNGLVLPFTTRKIQATATGTYAVRVTAPNNCISAYSPDYSFVPTGTKELNDAGISIYPNPTNGIVNVKIEAHHAAKIVVFNALGQQVLKSDSVRNGSTPLDLSKEAKGIYFIQITTEDQRTTRKILVQ